MSSQRYQEFIAERTRLLERIKELENENAELRKRLGELVEPVTSASNAMQNLSLQEKIDVFCIVKRCSYPYKNRIGSQKYKNRLNYARI